ncbi:hypothetical protein J6590_088631 [Homalodisca vitripennis]|nr:hypothetical protein J6590_089159 [Homalodisca vitripennis]KAG8285066.1 hypothetical protein J6590_088631 [Homalodisca vitripennis]
MRLPFTYLEVCIVINSVFGTFKAKNQSCDFINFADQSMGGDLFRLDVCRALRVAHVEHYPVINLIVRKPGRERSKASNRV